MERLSSSQLKGKHASDKLVSKYKNDPESALMHNMKSCGQVSRRKDMTLVYYVIQATLNVSNASKRDLKGLEFWEHEGFVFELVAAMTNTL